MRLIQLSGKAGRRVGLIEEDRVSLLSGYDSVYALVNAALEGRTALTAFALRQQSKDVYHYNAIHAGQSEWRVLPAIDHPTDPAHCMVSGTGLTHTQSAKNREAMHKLEERDAGQTSDSMRMYEAGLAGGRPFAGEIGIAPEWFYKGSGTILRGHNDPLDVPSYANDGGEEPEIAGLYIVDASGNPRRIGMAVGNEFSDHVLEKKNYLYLAASKLRTCSIGPELIVDAAFDRVPGEVGIERAGAVLWSKRIESGEAAMSHTLANLEHHHFKFEAHRRPGDVHVHFLGADAFSFGEGIRLADGDVMQVQFEGFGRALRNPVRVLARSAAPVAVLPV